MLYDPKWKAGTTADPYTLDGLIAWLEKQPADKWYDYDDCAGRCLLDTYIAEVSGMRSRPGSMHWTVCGGDINYQIIAHTRPWTYGAALDRARKVAGQ